MAAPTIHLFTELVIKPLGVFLSFIYPFYASFKALDSTNQESHAQWLTYWSVLGAVNFAEYFLHWLLKWIPLYYTMKICLVLWLQLPITKGAGVIYWRFLHPQIKKHEDKIDQAVVASRKRIGKIRDQLASAPASSGLPSRQPSANLRAANVTSRAAATDRVLQELEEGDMGEKGE